MKSISPGFRIWQIQVMRFSGPSVPRLSQVPEAQEYLEQWPFGLLSRIWDYSFNHLGGVKVPRIIAYIPTMLV